MIMNSKYSKGLGKLTKGC